MNEDKVGEVERLIAPLLAEMGFEVVRVMLTGGARRPTLQIMLERPDGSLLLDDCAEASRAISALLDVEDPIAGAYQLEVSSPGIDRPLTRLKDYGRYAGFEARLELALPRDGRRRFTGRLLGLEGETVLLQEPGADRPLRLPFAEIAKAKLLLTDELIAAHSGKSGNERA